MNEKPYWIVVSKSRGPSTLPYRYLTQSAAIAEACRLCRLDGGVFHVMEAQIRVSMNNVSVTRLGTEEDIPF